MSSISEKLFEDQITDHLVQHGGYRVCKIGTDPEWRDEFDAALGLDRRELFAFIEETQRPAWERLVKAHGGDDGRARDAFVRRLGQVEHDRLDRAQALDAAHGR